jgi:hypothetical protein
MTSPQTGTSPTRGSRPTRALRPGIGIQSSLQYANRSRRSTTSSTPDGLKPGAAASAVTGRENLCEISVGKCRTSVPTRMVPAAKNLAGIFVAVVSPAGGVGRRHSSACGPLRLLSRDSPTPPTKRSSPGGQQPPGTEKCLPHFALSGFFSPRFRSSLQKRSSAVGESCFRASRRRTPTFGARQGDLHHPVVDSCEIDSCSCGEVLKTCLCAPDYRVYRSPKALPPYGVGGLRDFGDSDLSTTMISAHIADRELEGTMKGL